MTFLNIILVFSISVLLPSVIFGQNTPPIITSESDDSSVTVLKGKSVELDCFATGVPTPTIQWHRENNTVLPTGNSTYSGNVLTIDAVRKEDSGIYYCVAENGIGKAATKEVYLNVQIAPFVSVPRPRVGQALHYDAELVCRIETYESPYIIWYKGDTQLSNDEHYSITNLKKENDFVDATLRISAIEKKHYGDYDCLAANYMGRHIGKVTLYKTVCPTADSIFELSGNSLIVKDSRYAIRYDRSTSSFILQTEAGGNDCQINLKSVTKKINSVW